MVDQYDLDDDLDNDKDNGDLDVELDNDKDNGDLDDDIDPLGRSNLVDQCGHVSAFSVHQCQSISRSSSLYRIIFI